MFGGPPISTRTATLVPYSPLFQSALDPAAIGWASSLLATVLAAAVSRRLAASGVVVTTACAVLAAVGVATASDGAAGGMFAALRASASLACRDRKSTRLNSSH